jgi:Zn ribbon nucleic-acid-binding protein
LTGRLTALLQTDYAARSGVIMLGPTTTATTMALEYRAAVPEDVAECLDVRGRTRENAISAEGLRARSITLQSWAEDVRQGGTPRPCVSCGWQDHRVPPKGSTRIVPSRQAWRRQAFPLAAC